MSTTESTPCQGYLTPDGVCLPIQHPIATMPPLPPVIIEPMPEVTYTPTIPVPASPPELAATGATFPGDLAIPVAIVLVIVGVSLRAMFSRTA